MKSFLALSFIKWIFKKIGKGIINLNSDYHNHMEHHPGEAIVIWILGSMVGAAILAFVTIPVDIHLVGFNMIIYWTLAFLYLITNGVTIMYTAFKEERQDLFNRLKDTN